MAVSRQNLDRDEKIMRFWAGGWSERDLAAKFNLHRTRIQAILRREKKAHHDRALHELDEIKGGDLAMIDEAIALCMRAIKLGDLKAIPGLAKLLERKARLMGTDAPRKVEVSGNDGSPLFDHAEQLRFVHNSGGGEETNGELNGELVEGS